jgi:hypothetical protein
LQFEAYIFVQFEGHQDPPRHSISLHDLASFLKKIILVIEKCYNHCELSYNLINLATGLQEVYIGGDDDPYRGGGHLINLAISLQEVYIGGDEDSYRGGFTPLPAPPR